MQKKPSRKRRKRCPACQELFEPDPRTKGKQRYCSKEACQKRRQRLNERDWRARNPECVEEQRKQTRLWYKAHPRYSRQRRAENPALLIYNRLRTLKRMRKIRQNRLFDKSKLILTQLSGNKEVKCYLTRGYGWLRVRLTKASLLSRLGMTGHNKAQWRQVSNSLPRGKLYDLSKEILNRPISGP